MKSLLVVISFIISFPVIISCSYQNRDREQVYAGDVYEYVDLDSLMLSIFDSQDSFSYPLEQIGYKRVHNAYSEDGNARLIAVDCGGSMCSGTSYILYKNNKRNVLKKIADMSESIEGYISMPFLYMEIHNSEDGYATIGYFQATGADSLYVDTLFVSKEFLDSDKFSLAHE